MIYKVIKFSLLAIISVFAIMSFIFFKSESNLVFGTMFDQSIFPKDNISAATKALVPLIGTLSFALLILLVIFFLYEVFLETKTFALVITMNIVILISMIVFSVYLYGFVLINNLLNETTFLTVGESIVSSLTYNIALAGTMISLVFVLFVFSNILWFPIVADKFRYKKKLGFSFKGTKNDKTQNSEISMGQNSNKEVDYFDELQPGLERNELQQRKVAASFGRIPIDEFEEAYGLDLKTQVLTDRNLGMKDPIYKTEIPKVTKMDLEVPTKSNKEIGEIFSDYENKLKDENFLPKMKEQEVNESVLEEGYIMPRNRSSVQNQSSDDLIFIPPSGRSKISEPNSDSMFNDLERIERLMSSKNRQVQFEPKESTIPEVTKKVVKTKKQKTKLISKQDTLELPIYDFTEVEDPLKEVVTNTINIDTDENDTYPKIEPKVFNEIKNIYEEESDEIFSDEIFEDEIDKETQNDNKSKNTSTIDWDLD